MTLSGHRPLSATVLLRYLYQQPANSSPGGGGLRAGRLTCAGIPAQCTLTFNSVCCGDILFG